MATSFIDKQVAVAIQTVSEKFDYLASALSDIVVITEHDFNKGKNKKNQFIVTEGCSLAIDDNTIVICNRYIKDFKKSPELLAFAIGWAAWIKHHDLIQRGQEKIANHWNTAANIRYEIDYGGHPNFDYFRRDQFIDDLRATVQFEDVPSLTIGEIYDRLVEEKENGS